jgi:hypothetical protein
VTSSEFLQTLHCAKWFGRTGRADRTFHIMLAIPNLFKHVVELKFSLIQGSNYAERITEFLK